ncbi:IQ domain-containing protein C [Poecilia latipinna]|uniref:IQ domain-containing protein C n=1 Tax=Poecilia latipinna TaxID=48699 RepID=UPI00072ED855|nr:PREDICTED: IQ domain-containing protein C [Poecilia latipinna]
MGKKVCVNSRSPVNCCHFTITMDRSKLDKIITHFQARARGYLTRTEVRRAREDFEEIVREVEGDLTHLRWTDTTLSIPHFTDTDGACLQPARRLLKPPDPELDVTTSQSPDSLEEEGQERCVYLDRKEAEREDWSSIPPRCDGGMMESTRRSSIVWSSPELEHNAYPQKGFQQYCLAQEVPRTSQALRLHRNTLTMELVWLQQAIDSRKKYLSLKDRLYNVELLAPDSP